VRERVRRKR
jgi:hypothetical protein